MDNPNEQRSTIVLRRFLADPAGSEEFRRFVAKYRPRIKEKCLRRRLQDADAEDVASALLLRWHEKDTFRTFVFAGKEKFNRWLAVTVRNAILEFHRQRGRRRDAWSLGHGDAQQALERTAAEWVGELDTICDEDLARGKAAMENVAKRIDGATLNAFRLQVFEEKKGAEVAAEVGMSLASVWKARSRVARMLREEFERLGGAEG